MAENGGAEPFLTVREAVMEIRTDVKDLAGKLERIDREGSIGTKEELKDHESRIRSVERWRWSIPGVAVLGAIAVLLDFIHRTSL